MTVPVYEYTTDININFCNKHHDIPYTIFFLFFHTHDFFFFLFQALGSKSSDASANNCFNRWKLCNRGKSSAYLNITITFKYILVM